MEQLGDFVKNSWIGKTLVVDVVTMDFNENGIIIKVGDLSYAYPYTTPIKFTEK